MDVLKLLKDCSALFQKSSAVLIGKDVIIRTLLDDLKHLQANNDMAFI